MMASIENEINDLNKRKVGESILVLFLKLWGFPRRSKNIAMEPLCNETQTAGRIFHQENEINVLKQVFWPV